MTDKRVGHGESRQGNDALERLYDAHKESHVGIGAAPKGKQ